MDNSNFPLIVSSWLTEKDVSLMTRLSVHTLRAHRFKHTGIPYSKIGRSVRYAKEDVLNFMEERRISFSR